MALFHEDLQRNCNVGALSICDIYQINTSQIKPLLDKSPAMRKEMMAIIDSRVTINANIDHKVQRERRIGHLHSHCTHNARTLHAHCTHTARTHTARTLHAHCTCTRAPHLHTHTMHMHYKHPHQVRSISSVSCNGALAVDFTLRYSICHVPCTHTTRAAHALHALHICCTHAADALRVFMCSGVRLQKRILNLQKRASTCRCRSSCLQSRLSIGCWSTEVPDTCGDAQRTDSAATVAVAQDGALQGVGGVHLETTGPLPESPPMKASCCRLASTTSIPSTVRGGKQHSSVNEIQLGAEAPKADEGVAAEERVYRSGAGEAESFLSFHTNLERIGQQVQQQGQQLQHAIEALGKLAQQLTAGSARVARGESVERISEQVAGNQQNISQRERQTGVRPPQSRSAVDIPVAWRPPPPPPAS